MPVAITPTFSPWTHTSDDSYIYQLSLVLATATVSYCCLSGTTCILVVVQNITSLLLVLKNVSCEYDLFEWLKLSFASCVVNQTRCSCFLWTKHTIWLLILSFTQNIVRACSVFCHEGYRSVTPLDAARVNRTIFHNHHSVHWYFIITLIKGWGYIKHDMNIRHGKQNQRRGRWL